MFPDDPWFKVQFDPAVIEAVNLGRACRSSRPLPPLADIEALTNPLLADCDQPHARPDRGGLFGRMARSFRFS